MLVRTPQPETLVNALSAAGIRFEALPPGGTPGLRIPGVPAAHIGHLAFTAGVELHELQAGRGDLEELFFSLTSGAHTARGFEASA